MYQVILQCTRAQGMIWFKQFLSVIGVGVDLLRARKNVFSIFVKYTEKIKLAHFTKDPHTAIFTDPTGCRKIHLVLDFIEKEYNQHFDYTVFACSTLHWNKTYNAKVWIKQDDNIWLIEPKNGISMRREVATIISRARNTIHRKWYNYWWKT